MTQMVIITADEQIIPVVDEHARRAILDLEGGFLDQASATDAVLLLSQRCKAIGPDEDLPEDDIGPNLICIHQVTPKLTEKTRRLIRKFIGGGGVSILASACDKSWDGIFPIGFPHLFFAYELTLPDDCSDFDFCLVFVGGAQGMAASYSTGRLLKDTTETFARIEAGRRRRAGFARPRLTETYKTIKLLVDPGADERLAEAAAFVTARFDNVAPGDRPANAAEGLVRVTTCDNRYTSQAESQVHDVYFASGAVPRVREDWKHGFFGSNKQRRTEIHASPDQWGHWLEMIVASMLKGS
jgi:hypothetical protein